jgi:hypothetical protein
MQGHAVVGVSRQTFEAPVQGFVLVCVRVCAGSSIEEIKKSPFVEKLLKKGYEVIYFTDVMDEYVMQVCARV